MGPLLLTIILGLFARPAFAEAPVCRAPARLPSSIAQVRVELTGPLAEILGLRGPATYIPRADEFRGDLRQFERRIMGAEQDVTDFMVFRREMQVALQNFRRLYPQQPIPAEDDLKDFYALMNVVFELFASSTRPENQRCLFTVARLENEFMGENSRFNTSADDVLLAVRLTEKLCRLR